MNRMLIIDGNSMLCECYYGTIPKEVLMKDKSEWPNYYHKIMRTKTGIFTNGIFTAMGKIEKIISEHNFTHVIVCVDKHGDRSGRNKLYPEYKANRERPDNSLIFQQELFPQVLSRVGIPVFGDERYEADDLIGTLATYFSVYMPVTIMSGDQDLTQLVRPGIQMWYTCKSADKAQNLYDDYIQGRPDAVALSTLGIPDKVFPLTTDSVYYLMKVKPNQVTDLKGLCGDASDNYPGVAGIGEKGAAALLSYFENIEAIFEKIESLGEDSAKIKEFKKEFSLKTGSSFPWKALTSPSAKEDAFLFKKIATILCNIPFQIPLDTLRLNISKLGREEIYKELEFFSLLHHPFPC